jgi:hypothetical protein
VTPFNALSCSSSTDCIGMTGIIANTTTNLGESWTQLPVSGQDSGSNPGYYLNAMSCPTSMTCVAVGDQTYYSGDYGAATSNDGPRGHWRPLPDCLSTRS